MISQNHMKILSKPKVIIPLFSLIGLLAIVFTYKNIGQAPVVKINQDLKISETIPATNLDLSFPKSGRLESVLIKNGQIVKKGQILAKLSAPDALGLVNQAKGTLELAQAEYASLNASYATTKKQQDLIVHNAYQTLISSGLEGIPNKQNKNSIIVSGTDSCEKEGTYLIKPYASADSDSGYSFNYSGLESGVGAVKYDNPIPLGLCGLQIKFTQTEYFDPNITWNIDIPNTKSSVYLTNKNIYNLAIENRNKVLADLANTIGDNSDGPSLEKAKINAAEGAYEAAEGAYQNNLIIAPIDGTVSYLDKDLIVGQSVLANKTVISLITK